MSEQCKAQKILSANKLFHKFFDPKIRGYEKKNFVLKKSARKTLVPEKLLSPNKNGIWKCVGFEQVCIGLNWGYRVLQRPSQHSPDNHQKAPDTLHTPSTKISDASWVVFFMGGRVGSTCNISNVAESPK